MNQGNVGGSFKDYRDDDSSVCRGSNYGSFKKCELRGGKRTTRSQKLRTKGHEGPRIQMSHVRCESEGTLCLVRELEREVFAAWVKCLKSGKLRLSCREVLPVELSNVSELEQSVKRLLKFQCCKWQNCQMVNFENEKWEMTWKNAREWSSLRNVVDDDNNGKSLVGMRVSRLKNERLQKVSKNDSGISKSPKWAFDYDNQGPKMV